MISGGQRKIGELLSETDFNGINKGAIAEQYAGLEILKAASCYKQEELFYWHREAKSSNAEVDYVVQKSAPRSEQVPRIRRDNSFLQSY